MIAFGLRHDVGDSHFDHLLCLALDHQVGTVHVHYAQHAVVPVEEGRTQVEDDDILVLALVVLVLLVLHVQEELVVAHVAGDLHDVLQRDLALHVGHLGHAGDVLHGRGGDHEQAFLRSALVVYLVTHLLLSQDFGFIDYF